MAVLFDEATELLFEELMKIEGKAEIVDGRTVLELPTGEGPGLSALQIVMSLFAYARRVGWGRAVGDNVAFRVDLPHRQSFSPDAAYIAGSRTGSMRAIVGAPIFAVEVRSENDYGPRMELQIARKIEDYFAAGTLAVWDVDLLGENVVTLHLKNETPSARVFRRGEIADAGAVLPDWTMPDWTMPVDEIFA